MTASVLAGEPPRQVLGIQSRSQPLAKEEKAGEGMGKKDAVFSSNPDRQ